MLKDREHAGDGSIIREELSHPWFVLCWFPSQEGLAGHGPGQRGRPQTLWGLSTDTQSGSLLRLSCSALTLASGVIAYFPLEVAQYCSCQGIHQRLTASIGASVVDTEVLAMVRWPYFVIASNAPYLKLDASHHRENSAEGA